MFEYAECDMETSPGIPYVILCRTVDVDHFSKEQYFSKVFMEPFQLSRHLYNEILDYSKTKQKPNFISFTGSWWTLMSIVTEGCL